MSVFGVAAGRASPPAACLAEGASEALARGFVPGLLLALSPLLLSSNPWLYSIIIADAPAIRNLPTRRSLTCIHF